MFCVFGEQVTPKALVMSRTDGGSERAVESNVKHEPLDRGLRFVTSKLGE